MKRILALLLSILLCFSFAGCKQKKAVAPYLDEAERSAIETGIFESMKILVDTDYDGTAYISFRNNSNYNLAEFYLMTGDENEVLNRIGELPAQTECAYSLSMGESWYTIASEADNHYKIRYTIGDYSYLSEAYRIDLSETGSEGPLEDLPPIQVFVDTVNGRVSLNLYGQNSFPTGNEIYGLVSSRIYELTGSVSYTPSGHYYYSLKFDIGAKAPDQGKTLVYKLFNSEGIILYVDSARLQDGNGTLYCFAELEPGDYTLVFEEID